ncbi:nuclear transport factor 2 family protein [Chitinophaga sp. Cy-1792]|uniref:nuclear transport factor 2 family protein n=1 Tax=Chitinophaga sp. Cy-1792 TaxID=2608339 RepID=UPI0014208760|nr:nuclear transport factor 2 family protein [Chitinophaga sp. Cy-1792]NIG52529.1 nuclear transport factor 2 family protein [Chitinophaga sp. Cy-1792]
MAVTENNSVQEYKAIVSVLENYVEGLRTGNIERLKKSFHQDAIMYGYWEEYFIEGGISNLYDSVEKHGAAPHFSTHIDILDKTENTALARIRYERNAADKDGVDYHSLIKVKGEWKVISKLFQISVKQY